LNGILCAFLRDHGSLSIKDTVAILFSTRNLKAFLDIYQLNMTDDPLKRSSILFSIGQSATTIATDEMQRILRHPLSSEKSGVLKSLFEYPRPALLEDLIREAQNQDSYNRREAIFALGAYPDPCVERLLIPLLDDPSARIRSTAAKSLARIGNTDCLETILRHAGDSSRDLWITMNYWIAISIMDQEGRYLEGLFQHPVLQQGANASQTFLALAAKMLSCEPALADFYQEENLHPSTGMKLFLEDAKQLQPFLSHATQLARQYAQGGYDNIWQWCRDLVEEHDVEKPLCYLQQSIVMLDAKEITKEHALALLYFTYQVLKE
jgi:hypothetical protein